MAVSPVLEARNITKSFPGIKALDNVSLKLHAGEVHALIGENGAGKSTLISILTCVNKPDAGELVINGRTTALSSPAAAKQHGVVAIYQELSIVPWLSVSANIVLGNEPGSFAMGQLLSTGKANAIAREALDRLGADDISVNALAGKLSTGQKQLVEIARVLALDPSVIIMDEPTSSLPRRDAERVLEIVQRLRSEGKAILFVSHRLDEVTQVADTVTVLRGGQTVRTAGIGDMTTNQMIEAMIGRKIEALFPPRKGGAEKLVLRAQGLSAGSAFQDISFELHRGEILGFYGLIGAGRSEVMRAISGVDPVESGELEMDGERICLRSPADAIAAGIVYLPEDRKDQGLVLSMSSRENIVLSTLARVTSLGMVRQRRIRDLTNDLARKVGIRGSLDHAVVNLSGGNQQKVIIARGLISGARVLIFDEPTRGIDVGAKYEIYCLIQDLASNGAAIILVSSEMPEIINVAHRAIVMSGGRIYGDFKEADYDERLMLEAAFEGFRAGQAYDSPQNYSTQSH